MHIVHALPKFDKTYGIYPVLWAHSFSFSLRFSFILSLHDFPSLILSHLPCFSVSMLLLFKYYKLSMCVWLTLFIGYFIEPSCPLWYGLRSDDRRGHCSSGQGWSDRHAQGLWLGQCKQKGVSWYTIICIVLIVVEAKQSVIYHYVNEALLCKTLGVLH